MTRLMFQSVHKKFDLERYPNDSIDMKRKLQVLVSSPQPIFCIPETPVQYLKEKLKLFYPILSTGIYKGREPQAQGLYVSRGTNSSCPQGNS